MKNAFDPELKNTAFRLINDLSDLRQGSTPGLKLYKIILGNKYE